MPERFLRTEMLLGPEAMARLRESHVAVFGLGGVGSWCAEALARTGVGTLTLVDQDTVSESNCNRQLCATAATVGRPKAEVMAARLKEICPESSFLPVAARYAPDTRAQFFSPPPEWDYLADCIDLVSCKLDLIVSAREAGVPVVSALGTGNKLDAGLLELCDISRTKNCPLARVVRRELRRQYGIEHLTVVYSPEAPRAPREGEAPPPGRRSVPGSLVWVPAAAGLRMAQHIVLELVREWI